LTAPLLSRGRELADSWTGEGKGAKVVATTVDVRKADEVETWIQNAINTFGRLDGAANIAGIAGGSSDTTVQTLVSKVV